MSVIVTVITDGLENSSTEYSLKAVQALIENSSTEYSLKAVQALIKHLKEQGWSFAYMGTDHDVESVIVSLSITNVVKFEKTEAETQAVFEKERRARKRYNDKMASYCAEAPCASAEDMKAYRRKISMEYYEED